MPGATAVHPDVSAREQAEQALRASEQYNRRLFETAAIGLVLSRLDGTLLDVNPAYACILGHSVEATLRLNFWQVGQDKSHDKHQQQQLEQLRVDGRYGPCEAQYVHRDGRLVAVRLSGVLLERNGEPCIWSSVEDITEQKQTEARITHLAHYDPLTGLANRTLICDRLGQAVIEAKRHARTVALARVDLDDFKGINDTLGHDIGDLILRDVAERLRHAVRPGDTVGRLGDDEFVITLADMARAEDAELVVQKLLAVFDEDFMLDGRAVFLSASMGVSVYPQDGEDAEELLRSSDIALLRAKRRGKGNYQFYDPVMSTHMLERRAVEDDLRQALARDEFVLHYQPVMCADDGSILGVEALLRWQHPERGLIPPLDFIPLAEDSGLIVPIGAWVLREACQQAAQWQRDGHPGLCLAVNVSARQFTANHVAEKVAQALDESGLDPCWLKLEITESSLMQQDKDVASTLKVLRNLGVSLAIDDFGTDYSNFAYLRALKPETLKIDRSLVSDIAIDTDAAAITHAIIAMAHHLSIRVVAEGVETAEQAALLRGQGCDALQGYYFGRPMAADALTALLAAEVAIPA